MTRSYSTLGEALARLPQRAPNPPREVIDRASTPAVAQQQRIESDPPIRSMGAELERRQRQTDRRVLRNEVLAERGLSFELAPRLQGATRAELEASADELRGQAS